MFDAKEAREMTKMAIEQLTKKQIKEITRKIKSSIKCGETSCTIAWSITEATQIYFKNLGYYVENINHYTRPPCYRISWNEDNKS